MRPEPEATQGRRLGEAALAPLNAWAPRTRWFANVAAAALTTAWCALLNGGRLMAAWGLPDVYFYMRLAMGRADTVARPFSSRPLAPLLARWIAGAGHWPVEAGFRTLAYLSLLWTLGVVFWLLTRSRAPRWTLPAVAAVPFWPQLLGYAGLPDPLYAALLAGLLVALEREWMYAAAALLFPLMLARESTALTLVCLLIAGWRELRWAGSAVAVASAAAGAAVVRQLSAGSLPNPEHLSGGLYMAGKVVANAFRSLGVVPWSNVYPVLCAEPAWQTRLPRWLPLGPIRSVGVCAWSPIAPVQAGVGLLVSFGVLPLLLLLVLRGRKLRAALFGSSALLRFCVLYGGVSLLLAPALGTWYARLFGYGWPLLLVAVPRLLGEADEARERRWVWVGLLAVHLLVCALGDRPLHRAGLVGVMALEAIAVALIVVHRRAPRERVSPV